MSNILLISPIPTHPPTGGNHVRVFALVDALLRLGHELTFLHVPWCPGSSRQMRRHWKDAYLRTSYSWPRPLWGAIALSRATQVLGLSVLHRWTKSWWLKNRPLDLWYDHRVEGVVQRLLARHQFDAVIVVYVLWSKVLELFDSSTLKIIDTNDIFTDRYKLLLKSQQVNRFWPWGSVSLSRDEEGRGLDRADVVLAIQPDEALRLEGMTRSKVLTVSHLLGEMDSPTLPPPSRDLLFVGSAWAPNVEGIRWFAREVLPLVRQQVPETQLVVAGQVGAHVPSLPGCVKMGVVSDLASLYRRSAVAINPVPSGTGLAIKSIEAMKFGRPLVASPAGARGLEEAPPEALAVSHTPDQWCEALCRLLNETEWWIAANRAALEFAEHWNFRQLEQLQKLLADAGERRPVSKTRRSGATERRSV